MASRSLLAYDKGEQEFRHYDSSRGLNAPHALRLVAKLQKMLKYATSKSYWGVKYNIKGMHDDLSIHLKLNFSSTMCIPGCNLKQ